MKERCIDIRCIFFFAVILHRINDNKDNFRTTIETMFRGNRSAKRSFDRMGDKNTLPRLGDF